MTDDGDFPNAATAAYDAALTVLEDAAAKVLDRSRRFTLDAACDRLGVDVDRVRERAAQLREGEGRDD